MYINLQETYVGKSVIDVLSKIYKSMLVWRLHQLSKLIK